MPNIFRMSTRDGLHKIPVVRWIVTFLEKIRLPGFEGMSVYEILEMYITGIIKGTLTTRAGSIAFSFFIALFPFALFILTLIPFVPIPGFQEDFMELIFNFTPSQSSKEAIAYVLNDIANNKYAELLSFGFFLSMFLMTNGVNAILNSFEYTYHNIQTRTIVRQYFVSLIITLVLVVVLIIAVAGLIFCEIFIDDLKDNGLIDDAELWMKIIRLFFLVMIILISFSLLFYFGTREGRRLNFFSPGTILTTLLFILNFEIFGIYIEKFAQYNKLYGSIGTVLIIMLFIYLNSIILLLGFELNTTITKLHEEKTSKHI
jgi:membrane protein